MRLNFWVKLISIYYYNSSAFVHQLCGLDTDRTHIRQM